MIFCYIIQTHSKSFENEEEYSMANSGKNGEK